MSRNRTYRVIVRKTEAHFIDVPAASQTVALKRAEAIWHGPHHSCFQIFLEHEPEAFEIDELASEHLGDVVNEERAQWAETALRTFSRDTGSDMGPEALHDLLCDLGHYADTLGLCFEDEIARAAETWAEEKAEEARQ